MKKTLALFAAGMIPAMLFAVPFTLVPMWICIQGRPLAADSNAKIYIDNITCTIKK